MELFVTWSLTTVCRVCMSVMCDCHSCSVCVCVWLCGILWWVVILCVYYKVGHSGKPLDQGCACVSSLYNSGSRKGTGGRGANSYPTVQFILQDRRRGEGLGTRLCVCVCVCVCVEKTGRDPGWSLSVYDVQWKGTRPDVQAVCPQRQRSYQL